MNTDNIKSKCAKCGKDLAEKPIKIGESELNHVEGGLYVRTESGDIVGVKCWDCEEKEG